MTYAKNIGITIAFADGGVAVVSGTAGQQGIKGPERSVLKDCREDERERREASAKFQVSDLVSKMKLWAFWSKHGIVIVKWTVPRRRGLKKERLLTV